MPFNFFKVGDITREAKMTLDPSPDSNSPHTITGLTNLKTFYFGFLLVTLCNPGMTPSITLYSSDQLMNEEKWNGSDQALMLQKKSSSTQLSMEFQLLIN